MSKLSVLLQKEYRKEYRKLEKPNYSGPEIYDANGDLSKRWYVYFSFRNPATGYLEKQTPIYGDINSYKNKSERKAVAKAFRDSLERILKDGFNPYDDNLELDISSEKSDISNIEQYDVDDNSNVKEPTIAEAFQFALKIKQKQLNDTSYANYQSRIKRFETWLNNNGYNDKKISNITRKTATTYLNSILDTTSPRNRNNTRADLSSLFSVLEKEYIIKNNFFEKIDILKSKPERNKTYTPTMQEDIYSYLEINDPILLLFIKFISYNFLRPVEVCRLQIGDLDITDKKLYVRTKNKPVKIKIIPEILINDLPDLSKLPKDTFLFTPDKIGDYWLAEENNRRDNFSKRFKLVVKDYFKLSEDYTMYSFRHTFITKLYREMRKKHSAFEAKSNLMLITGHLTMSALEKYLRDIDAELPEDYSNMLK